MMEPGAERWLVYLLRCRDGTYYCGVTKNLVRRLAQHNGKLAGGAKYTKNRRPVYLVGSVECSDKSSALKLEYEIKKMGRGLKRAFFSTPNPDSSI